MKTALSKMIAALLIIFAVSMAQAATDKHERVLIVVSELQQHGPENLRLLYTAVEDLTRVQSNIILGDDYKQVIHLRRTQATLSSFKAVLRSQAAKNDVKAIDVIMSLHGSPGKLFFREGEVETDVMTSTILQSSSAAETILVNKLKKKLRMVYNLSCFGRSHNQAFRNMGFDVTVGSNGINANSEIEFIAVLTAWSFGSTFGGAFDATNNDGALAAADLPVRATGINADSRKYFRGDQATKIGTAAE